MTPEVFVKYTPDSCMLVIDYPFSGELHSYMSIYGHCNKSTKGSLSSSADIYIYYFINEDNLQVWKR